MRAAKTIAAFQGRTSVTPADVREAIALALPHRMRKRPFEEPEIDPGVLDDLIPDRDDLDSPDDETESPPQEQGESDEPHSPPPSGQGKKEAHGIGSPVDTAPIQDDIHPDRTLRKTARGRRIPTPTEDPRGRKTSTAPTAEWRGLSLDATIRAAAPHQRDREKDGNAISILPEDLRRARRNGKAEVACVFVVDASGSMGAEKRMESAKGAVLSLLEDAYKNRDRIGLVAFRGDNADVLLPLSRSVELAYQRLSDIPTGGRTPLALGLEKGRQMLERERKKRRDILPMMMLISDGRANTGMGGEIRQEIRSISAVIAEAGIRTVVIDTETVSSRQPLSLGYCREIADISGGSYYPIAELSAGAVEEIARREGGLFVGS